MIIRKLRYGAIALVISLFCSLSANAQNLRVQEKTTPTVGIKTNLLYDATATINLGVEFKVGRQLTLDVPVNYNPFSFKDNRKWKHVLVQPELRWWTCEPFSGHFFGLHAHYAYYNIGNLPSPFSEYMKAHRFEGWLAGAGISYGYQFYIAPRLNLEMSVGVGYAYLKYDRYACESCGDFKGKEDKHYFGPTKASISLIYLF